MKFLESLWAIVQSLGVWFLFGLLIAALMHAYVPAKIFKKWLGKNSFIDVVKAAFIGVPMPLCSCGVVPTVIALKKKGASNSACLSFLISTPQTGVDSLLVSASFLSWPFAIFKLASAFIIGIFGGGVHQLLSSNLEEQAAASETELQQHSKQSLLKGLWDFAINDLFYNLWRWMVAGIVAATLISTFVSDDFLGSSIFADPLYGSIAALFLSIPLYVCATSSVPIAAVLIAKGMSPAVAIVFLIAGPATNIATIGLIYKSFGKMFTTVYLASVSIGSVLSALFFSSVINLQLPGKSHTHTSGNDLEFLGAILFSLIILSFLYQDIKKAISSRVAKETETITIRIEGMTCQGCVNKIRMALIDAKLAKGITGDPKEKTLRISGSELNLTEIKKLVELAGFSFSED